MGRPRIGPALAGTASLLSWPGVALAHSPLPGIEGFYIGLLHPAGAPEPLLCAITLGLLLGVAGPAVARPAWGAFALALACGLAWSFAGAVRAPFEWLPLAAALAAALASVVGFPPGSPTDLAKALPTGWSTRVAVGLSAFGGVAMGLGSVPDPGPAGDVLVTIAGSFVGANVLLLLAFGAVDLLRERLPAAWVLIGSRVLAGWLVAIIVMLLALTSRS